MTTQNTISLGLVKTAFTSENYPEYFKGEHTHKSNVSFVNQLLRYTTDVDRVRQIVASGLPADYEGDAVDEVETIVNSGIKKGYDQHPAAKKPQKEKAVAERVAETIDGHEYSLFHDAQKRGFISIAQSSGGFLNYLLKSELAHHWVRKVHYEAEEGSLSAQQVNDIIETLEARANFAGAQEEVSLRIAGNETDVYFDLGRNDAKLVHINADGWSFIYETPVKFYRSAGFLELPEPVRGGNLQKLCDLLQLSGRNWAALVAFLLNCLKPEGPYMCLLVEGEQGSGKSFVCEVLKQMIDPNQAAKMRLPDNERDLMIMAKEAHLLSFDNASFIKPVISDMLCVLSTGGGFSTRKLYSNDGLQVFSFSRPYIINGISNIGNRPDLLDRAIYLQLPAMEEDRRKGEREMKAQFAAILPEVLGCLFDCVAAALANLASVSTSTTLRMLDSAQWLVAAEPATGLPEGSLMSALEDSQAELIVERVINHPLTIRLKEILETGSIKCTVGELHEKLKEDGKLKYGLPQTPAHLSSALDRLKPALKKTGILVTFGEKTRTGKPIYIRFDTENEDVAEIAPSPVSKMERF